MTRSLWIWMEDRRLGVLDGSDPRSPRITYDDEWANDPTSTPVSTSMPLAGGRYSGAKVHAWLWGLLPDNNLVLERWAARHQCSASDVVGLLAGVGADVAGAAQFLQPGEDPGQSQDGTNLTVSESDIAEMLRNLRADGASWHQAMGGRWSLAGAQAKLVLTKDPQTGKWSVPAGSAPSTHILKPAITGLDHHDLNEHLCMKTANLLGFEVAQSEITHFDDERAQVITRYDRIHHSSGSTLRIHQEDFCQALGIHPAHKYENEGGPGLADMVKLLRGIGLRNPQPYIHDLARATALNWLILGTDAHAKNYSLLLSGPQVRPTPLYDVASAAGLDEHPSKLKLAQKIGGAYRPTVIRSRHWERLGELTRVGAEQMVAEVMTMARALPDAFATAIAGEVLDADEAAYAAGLLDRLAAWNVQCQRILATATVTGGDHDDHE
jgi:serine/threonine-protein kinase HipA